MIVECRPDGVAPSQSPSGGPVVCDPPAIAAEAMDADGPTIVSPAVPSSSAPIVEVIADGDVPGPTGDRPSTPVFKDVGCQTDVGLCPSVATQASIVHPSGWVAVAESQTPSSQVCHVRTCLQRELACCVRYTIDRVEVGKVMVTLCREDLLNALLTARASSTRSSCCVVGWQPGQRDSSSQACSDGFSMSGGCNPLIVCALVCPSVFCKIIAQSIYGRSLHDYKINLPDARGTLIN